MYLQPLNKSLKHLNQTITIENRKFQQKQVKLQTLNNMQNNYFC